MPTALETRPDEGTAGLPRADGIEERGVPRSPRFRLVLLVALVGVLVLTMGAIAYLGATRATAHLGLGGDQEQLQAERDAVMSQSEQFMLRINTYGPALLEGDQMPVYRRLAEEVMTPKFYEDFLENVPIAEQTVAEAGLGRTAAVFSTGVSVIDADSATALVAGQFVNSYPREQGSEERVETEPAPFRVEVKLVRIDGEWLVDDFTPISGEDPAAEGGPS